jgi:predicted nucleic acid-binding protein
MIKVFLDTNILIDYLSRREPFFVPAALLLQLGKRKKCQLMVSSLSFATASFILQAHYKMTHEAVVTLFAKLVEFCHITTVDAQTVQDAIASDFKDFEDALQYYSAARMKADYIVTRNEPDFNQSAVPVYTPVEFLNEFK